MSKHTPGPWRVTEDLLNDFPAIVDAKGERVAVQPLICPQSKPVKRANAGLMSAAPEMLEVLEDLVDILEEAARSEMDDEGMVLVSYGAVYFALGKAHDVIRKAMGEA